MIKSKTKNEKRNSLFLIRHLVVWFFVSLIAIVITASNPILGLLGAGVGGIVFGILLSSEST